jgi:L-ascorbate metabolism protein UlaG (beta-lactamase superfamily)
MAFNSFLYFGHSAVSFESDNIVVAVDPWLKDNPLCPEQLKNPEKLDVIVLTHGHSDHAGDAVRLQKETGAKIVAVFELAMLLSAEGVRQDYLFGMNTGGTANFDGVSITFTPAFHSSSFEGSKGTSYAGQACGVVLKHGEQSIYHAGDTCFFSDMRVIRELHKPQTAFLPIGDVYTMGPVEAAQAAKTLGVKTAVPIHFGTFPALTGEPAEFRLNCAEYDVEAMVLAPGDRHKF